MARPISRETLSVGIIAILVGLVAAGALRWYLTPTEAPPVPKPPPQELIRIPLASADLPADRVVSVGDVVQILMTKRQIAERFKGMNAEEILTSPAAIAGRILRKPVARGEPFLTTNLYLEGTRPDIAKSLPPGFLAVRVLVPQTREVNLQPGNFVDVFFRANPRRPEAGQPAIPERTITLLRHVEVLETARPPAGSKTAAPNPARTTVLVTLAVPEQKADFFSIVEGRGDLWLLPTPANEAGEASEAVPNASTLAQLLGVHPPKRPTPPFETVIFRRSQVQVNRFVDGKLVLGHGQPPKLMENLPPAAPAGSRVTPQKEEE